MSNTTMTASLQGCVFSPGRSSPQCTHGTKGRTSAWSPTHPENAQRTQGKQSFLYKTRHKNMCFYFYKQESPICQFLWQEEEKNFWNKIIGETSGKREGALQGVCTRPALTESPSGSALWPRGG